MSPQDTQWNLRWTKSEQSLTGEPCAMKVASTVLRGTVGKVPCVLHGNSLAVYPTNLGGDPEMRYTPGGVPVTNFSLAVNKSWTGQDGQKQDKTTWFRVTTWK